MTVWTYAIISVIFVSLVSLIGLATLAVNARFLKEIVFVSVGFAAGALFGDAFIHLIPESFDKLPGQTPLCILLGIFAFFGLEKFLRWRHGHSSEVGGVIKPVGYMNLFGDGVHNYIDGMLIGASYLTSPSIGLSTTIAVILHEVPQEIGDFGVLLHAGFSRNRALLLNFFTATLAILGAVTALLLGGFVEQFSSAMLPFTAGGFIYIAGSDLIPELQQEVSFGRSAVQLCSLLAGVSLMLALS